MSLRITFADELVLRASHMLYHSFLITLLVIVHHSSAIGWLHVLLINLAKIVISLYYIVSTSSNQQFIRNARVYLSSVFLNLFSSWSLTHTAHIGLIV